MKRCLVFLVSFMVFLTACGSPEAETGGMKGTHDSKSLQKDNGRQIIEQYEKGEGILVINAQVKISEGVIESGTIISSLPSVQDIEMFFSDGTAFNKSENNSYDGEEWRVTDSDGGIRLLYSVDASEQAAKYDNYENYIEIPGMDKSELECSEAEQHILNDLTNTAKNMLEELSIRTEVFSRNLLVSDDLKYKVNIRLNPMIDGMRTVGKEHQYLYHCCSINQNGIETLQFCRIVEKNESSQTKIISVDEVLELLKKYCADGMVSTNTEIDTLELVYYVDYDANIFYPVWCFSGAFGNDGFRFADICINAETGVLVY